MSGNEKQRKWKWSESITISLCTWQTTELLCHGNAHNSLVFAMQRCHDEDKWKIPKEKKTCLPGHYTLEITSYWKLCLCFLLFLWTQDPSESCKIHPCDPAAAAPTISWWHLCERDKECVRTAFLAPAACVVLLPLLHQHQFPILPGFGEERLHFQFANTDGRLRRELKGHSPLKSV